VAGISVLVQIAVPGRLEAQVGWQKYEKLHWPDCIAENIAKSAELAKQNIGLRIWA
jgi:hypothetical protein